MRRSSGFTLIEILIVLAVLAIIGLVAVPSYFSYLTGARRAEAQTALMAIGQGQERWYINNNTYTGDINDLVPALVPQSSIGTVNYNYDITVADNQTFTARATAVNAQAGDADCPTMTLDAAGNRLPAICW